MPLPFILFFSVWISKCDEGKDNIVQQKIVRSREIIKKDNVSDGINNDIKDTSTNIQCETTDNSHTMQDEEYNGRDRSGTTVIHNIEQTNEMNVSITNDKCTKNHSTDIDPIENIPQVESNNDTTNVINDTDSNDEIISNEPHPIAQNNDTDALIHITPIKNDETISNEPETYDITQNEHPVLQNHDTAISDSSVEHTEMIPIPEQHQETKLSEDMIADENIQITIESAMFVDKEHSNPSISEEDVFDDELDVSIFKKYKSAKDLLDDESIESLLKMELTQEVLNVVNDRSLYVLPLDEEDALFHLERDLRKLKYSLMKKGSAQRKYAKITMLKHYHVLNAIYTKYCKIGGDRHWMNFDGYISLLRDIGIIQMGKNVDNERYFEIFHEIYVYHSKHSHNKRRSKHCNKLSKQLSGLYGAQSFNDDKDPWTGIWCKDKDKQRIYRIEMKKREAQNMQMLSRKRSIKQKSEEYVEKYKLRKIGDKRIIGCMNNIDYAEIGGTFEQSNYKKAKIEIKFKKRRIKVYNQHRVWCCELIPPVAVIDDIKMKVKWEEINPNSSQIKEGTFMLFKHDELPDDDIDIPIPQYVGLSRCEFFDAMLSCSHVMHEKQSENPFIGGFLGKMDEEKNDDECKQDLYIRFDTFVNKYLNEYIYKHHCELSKYLKGKEIKEEVKEKLKTYNAVLMKLFKKYASLDNSEITTKQVQEIDCDEWTAMALELCAAAKTLDKHIWKYGGKPSMVEIIQCFTLSVDDDILNQDEISFVEFQRCLIIFTNAIFKYQPKTRYTILCFDDKLDLVLKWCEKLEAQKIKISSASYTRSETLKQIKRKRESMNNHENDSNTSILSPKTSGNLSVTYTNAPLLLRNSV